MLCFGNTTVLSKDSGLAFEISGEGEKTSFIFNQAPVVQTKFGWISYTRELNHGNESQIIRKTFLLGLKDGSWQFVTQFDGTVAQTIQWDAKRMMFLSDDQKFISTVKYGSDGKGGQIGSSKETLKRSLVVVTVAVADFAARTVQTTVLFDEAAPAQRASMFEKITWDEAGKIITVTSTKQPVQLKWDAVKMKFVQQ